MSTTDSGHYGVLGGASNEAALDGFSRTRWTETAAGGLLEEFTMVAVSASTTSGRLELSVESQGLLHR